MVLTIVYFVRAAIFHAVVNQSKSIIQRKTIMYTNRHIIICASSWDTFDYQYNYGTIQSCNNALSNALRH